MPRLLSALFVGLIAGLAFGLAGCGTSQPKHDPTDHPHKPGEEHHKDAEPESKAAPSSSSKNTAPADSQEARTAENPGEHGHSKGQHGGMIVSLGRDSYHVEAIVTKAGELKLYTLGSDESRIQDIEVQELTAYAKPDGDAESVSFTLKATPQPGDQAGQSSLFVGQIPADLKGRKLTITVPSITIKGERFRLGFTTGEESHTDAAMPKKVESDAEKDLYLTPGGLYTAADIEANGGVTASQKFKGIKSRHDLIPGAGDKLCPITQTKANPQFTWVIGGKSYEFCCPPCVDEFLATAKKSPSEVKSPDEYIKR